MESQHHAPADRAHVRADHGKARSQLPVAQREAADQRRTALLQAFLADEQRRRGHGLKLAAYLSIPPEPDTIALVNSWAAPVLVPALRTWGRTKQAQWSFADPSLDDTTPGWHAIPEPTREPVDEAELANIDVIIVSALAVDPQGNRIGTGGGWFDRALRDLNPDSLRVCLVNDDEILPEIAAEPHDEPVDVIVTPERVLVTGARGRMVAPDGV